MKIDLTYAEVQAILTAITSMMSEWGYSIKPPEEEMYRQIIKKLRIIQA